MKVTVCLLLMSVLWFVFFNDASVTLGDGVLAPAPPEQVTIIAPESFSFNEYTITPLATFHITAKVLARKKYRRGREADLAPVDFALGWGKMSDEQVLADIDISQSNRWYFWKVKQFPIPRREIETHSGNMHLIPANAFIHSLIKSTRVGEIIELKGKLVRVDAEEDDWHWRSSLSRTDKGNHACEVIWVEEFSIQNF